MQIQVHTGGNVEAGDGLAVQVEADFESALSRFSDQITRVEVHLDEEAAGRSEGGDKTCRAEARPSGQKPVAVTHHAQTLEEAAGGAADKLEHLLESRFGRLRNHKGGESIRHLPVDEELL